MNKKLLALAVAGATFAPAVMAQTANPVTLYGRIWVMANSVKASSGATTLSTRTTIVDESSLIGFRGTEDLGGGLKAFFQLESSAPPDAGGGTFGSRNSGVGLQGGFGSIFLGRWDSPFKLSAIFVDPFGQNTLGNQLGVINTGDFNRRENNTIQYWSPNFNGFSARFMYGANEGKTATANPDNVSFSLDYAAGPFRINYANEKHKDYRGATVTAGVTEKGQNLSGTFVFGAFKVGLLTQKFDSTGRTDRKASMGAITYTVGNNAFHAMYGTNKDGGVPGALQPKSKQAGIGYDLSLSKRTTFMARYASLVNNGASSNSAAAFGLPALALNNDPKGISAGFRHTF
ncbi:MAG: porin [Usitatibacteraceae bacterium]